MSLTLIEVDGRLYHAQDIYDDESDIYLATIPILGEDGDMVPASVCLCYAHEPSECVCATTAWKNWNCDDEDYWEES